MQPFFSVVIPTKNRPYYLRQAIQSVVWQDFSDVEVIVSDNFNDEQTKAVVDEFSSDQRLKYFRTDREMNMCDHWEWASMKAQGKYVLILTDRKLLCQNALKILYRVISKNENRFSVYSFAVRMYDEERNRFGYTVPKGKSRVFKAAELLDNFLTKNIYLPESYDFFFPKSLNGCYRNEWVREVRKKFGSYFNQPGVTTPDFSSFFINVAENDETFYLAEYLILTQGEAISTGRQIGLGQASYIESLNSQGLFNELPLKNHSSYNLVMNDFFKIRKIAGGKLASAHVDWPNYFATNFIDIMKKKSRLGEDDKANSQSEAEFEHALSIQSPSEQVAIRSRIDYVKNNLPALSKRHWSFEILMQHFFDFMYHRLNKFQNVTRYLKLTFKNSLSAAGF